VAVIAAGWLAVGFVVPTGFMELTLCPDRLFVQRICGLQTRNGQTLNDLVGNVAAAVKGNFAAPVLQIGFRHCVEQIASTTRGGVQHNLSGIQPTGTRTPEGWAHSKTLARMDAITVRAKRLGLRAALRRFSPAACDDKPMRHFVSR
jgi:hypothetical protein